MVDAKSVGTDIALMAVFGFMGYEQAAKQMHAAGHAQGRYGNHGTHRGSH